MNSKFHSQRTAVLEQMAALQSMEQGSLKTEYRDQPSGAKSGPYFKHQVWRDGANVSQRISPEDAPALAAAIAHRQKCETLAADFIELTVAHTRQNQFPDSLKKRFSLPSRPRRRDLADNGALLIGDANRDCGARTGSAHPHRSFQTGPTIVGCLLQGAADRIDSRYQPKPGEECKGREAIQVQCLFGTFELQRDYYYHPDKKSGHHPTDAALGLEGTYTPGLARLICLEGADEST